MDAAAALLTFNKLGGCFLVLTLRVVRGSVFFVTFLLLGLKSSKQFDGRETWHHSNILLINSIHLVNLCYISTPKVSESCPERRTIMKELIPTLT